LDIREWRFIELARIQQGYLRWNRKIDLHQKRLGSADEEKDVNYGLGQM